MTIEEKFNFIGRFESVVFQQLDQGWDVFIENLYDSDFINTEEYNNLLRISTNFSKKEGEEGTRAYIILVNLVYEKIKNHTF